MIFLHCFFLTFGLVLGLLAGLAAFVGLAVLFEIAYYRYTELRDDWNFYRGWRR